MSQNNPTGETVPHFRRPLLETPFHSRIAPLNQIDRFTPWAGYTTADVFHSTEQEYFAARNTCSLYDLTPMVKYRITGADAERYLNRLVTRNIAKLKPNRVAYTVWCNDAGHVIDDGTVFRLGAAEFLLCTAERQINWLLDSAIGFAVDIAEITSDIAALSLQGPTSYSVLKALSVEGVEKLKPFDLGTFTLASCPVTISRTGFTGDLGYELWMRPHDAGTIWDALMAAGAPRGIRMLGSHALDMLRIEAGFIMPNIDFISAESAIHIGRERTPFELGLGWAVDLNKAHFNGRRALLAEQQRPAGRRLVGVDIAGDKPAHNALLYADKNCTREIGAITSAIWSPTCKRNIGLAMISAPYFALGSAIWAEIYVQREITWERKLAPVTVVEKPFYQPERKRLTPPLER